MHLLVRSDSPPQAWPTLVLADARPRSSAATAQGAEAFQPSACVDLAKGRK